MKGRLKKLFSLLLASAIAAGAFNLCAFCGRLPSGTYVGGVYVGGSSPQSAVKAVRADITQRLKNRSLTVHAGRSSYVLRYPELAFKDDAAAVVKSITHKGEYNVNVRYYINGMQSVVSGICAAQSQVKREPCAIFYPSGNTAFEYEDGVKGVYCDKQRLAADITKSLNGGFEDVYLHTKEFSPAKTLEEVMQNTVLLSAFTTYFRQEDEARSHNIRLAAKRVSGAVIAGGGSFSFNEEVGPRTAERGFKKAKVIAGGKYVYGIGGGVCQVSTTLYNAALLAGLQVTEYHPHSLAVGYVSPSRDAMVSGTYCDLKIKNLSDCPAYIRVLTGSGSIRCEIYGKQSGTLYSLNSELVEKDESGRVISRLYLTEERGGESRARLLRTDSYLPYAVQDSGGS